MRSQCISLVLLILLIYSSLFSCSNSNEQEKLDYAETIMEVHPDSALTLLSSIDKRKISRRKQKAQYALLMSIALDKNYIDTTTFDVLQPAIDYYLKKGTPDEKLRTYYYQGVIFQNQGDRDNALNSYVKGLHISHNCKDSLTIARTLVAQGDLYNDFFDFDSYIRCNLKAAIIFKNSGKKNNELGCLLNALNGAIIDENKNLCDSILNCIQQFPSLTESQQRLLTRHKLSFALKFGSENEVKELVHIQEANSCSQTDKMNLALAYNKIGNYVKAKQLLDSIENSNQDYDTIRFLAISVPTFEGLGNYNEALSLYKTFIQKQDSINLLKFEQKTQAVEEKHRIELKAQDDAQHKSRIIWWCFGGIAVLSLVIVILFLLVRSNKTKKELALEKVKKKEVENEKVKTEKDNLVLENQNLQLERDKKALAAEILTHRVDVLENEIGNFKALINERDELPLKVQGEIKIRIEMLNSLLASYITNNDQYEKPYDDWIKEITDNKDEFMNSNRLAFKVSHPRFIQYFEDHSLTTDEINYVCLYAIGLKGKEVGNYMNKRSHVNTSSAIRKKLGIDKHETNIGIYVRKLLKKL
jgi:tetratricopeptide (TPR) repeat protein